MPPVNKIHSNQLQYPLSGSFSGSFTGLINSASYAVNALSASYFSGSISNAISASYALTASYVANASSFPYTGSAIITGSLTLTGNEIITGSSTSTLGYTGSLFGTASYATTASFATNALTASYFSGSITNATSASYASTASYVINAQTASYFSGSISNATSASYATTASYVNIAQTASYFSGSISNATSASYALTASYALNGGTGGSSFPYTGSAQITGSLGITGSLSVSSSALSFTPTSQLLINNSVLGNSGATIANKITSTIATTYANDGLIALDIDAKFIGSIDTISPISFGSGYTVGTYTNVPINGASGTSALATVNIYSSYMTFTITNGGSGYTLYEYIVLPNTYIGGTGTGLQVQVVVLGNNVVPLALRLNGSILVPYTNVGIFLGSNIGLVAKVNSSGVFAYSKDDDFNISQTDTGTVYPGANNFTSRLQIEKSNGKINTTNGIAAAYYSNTDNVDLQIHKEIGFVKKQGEYAAVAYNLYSDFVIAQSNGSNSSIDSQYNTFTKRFVINRTTGNVGINVATPDASAILDVTSTTKGVLFPRMTTTQKNAISSPVAGLVVYDTTLNKLAVYTGAAWETITSS